MRHENLFRLKCVGASRHRFRRNSERCAAPRVSVSCPKTTSWSSFILLDAVQAVLTCCPICRPRTYIRRVAKGALLRHLTSITPCESAFEHHRPCRLRGRLLHNRRLHPAGYARLADPLDGRYFASHVSRTRPGIGALGCVRGFQGRDAHRRGERNFLCFGVVNPRFQTTERIRLCSDASSYCRRNSASRRPYDREHIWRNAPLDVLPSDRRGDRNAGPPLR